MDSFNHEGSCYIWMIPKLQAMRTEKNLQPLAFPNCFYSSKEDSILILENLKTSGYEVVPKKLERKSLNLHNFIICMAQVKSYCKFKAAHSCNPLYNDIILIAKDEVCVIIPHKMFSQQL